MGYYDNVNEDLLAAIPPDARKICEVGCGSGAMAALYKRMNPDCAYHGVELDFTAYQKAKASGVFSCIENANVENMYGYNLNCLEPDLDCVIFGDVLEHLKNPWKVLEHVANDWLKTGGQVIACVPNMQNFTLVGNLLAGSFHYADEGLLDRTHLRWFTRHSLGYMFHEAGLTVTSVEPRNWTADSDAHHAKFMKAMEPFIEKYGLDREDFKRDTRAFQWLIKGTKGDAPKRQIAIRSFASNHCCGRPRLTEPGKFLATIPGVRYSDKEMNVRDHEEPVAIVQREKFNAEQVKKWIKSGVLVIGEWDDYPGYFEENTKTDYLPIRGVHAISTSTQVMADTLLKWNPNVGVFYNQLACIPPAKKEKTGPVRLFCAWQKRTEDWKEIIDPLNEILAKNPKVEVYVIYDREFYHEVKTQNKTFWSFQHYEKYLEIMRECDIAILPMLDNEFSKHKSDIKLLECAANGVVALAGDCLYSDTSQHAIKSGIRGWVAATYHSPETFGNSLRLLIESSEQREAFRENAMNYVKDMRLLKDHYRDRYSWINALLDTREELTEQLLERCPELRS